MSELDFQCIEKMIYSFAQKIFLIDVLSLYQPFWAQPVRLTTSYIVSLSLHIDFDGKNDPRWPQKRKEFSFS